MADKYLNVTDLMEIIGFKESKCRKVIRELNAELREKGYITFQGKVSEKYFYERCFPKIENVPEEAATSTSTKEK